MAVKSKASVHYDAVIALPFCHLGVSVEAGAVIGCDYLAADTDAFQPEHELIDKVIEQLQAYSDNAQYVFDLNLKLEGTPFQRRVWKRLLKIPAGTVLTYGELANQLSSSARAVGNACRANPLPLLVPCHRVVAASGLGGFAGASTGYLISIKRQLLRHEGLEF
ncbi:MAG: methylated-DNA--[protein]-cysteine S-methyltransferase [Gammaproteobacteria bacterium]|nr:methylated-DNA--[protein]-cysteine S-methyltransferase [Gammaproteobacteria bacterium]